MKRRDGKPPAKEGLPARLYTNEAPGALYKTRNGSTYRVNSKGEIRRFVPPQEKKP